MSPEKLFHYLMWLVSLLFAGFLIGLGGKVIADIPAVTPTVSAEAFVDPVALQANRDERARAREELAQLQPRMTEARGIQTERLNAYNSAKSANENWLATRSVTSNNQEALAQDPALLKQTRELEALNTQLRQAQIGTEPVAAQVRAAQRAQASAQASLDRALTSAQPMYQGATRHRELLVFAYRLALTLPLLLVAAWLVVKKRKSSHWPLSRGFVIFAAFAFFVELVPYLPSYGGYVRYGVGIALLVAAGHYGIRWMQGYLVRRQAEALRNEAVRRSSLDASIAIKKIAAKICPGCERPIPPDADGVKVNNCVYCGLKLFDVCDTVDAGGANYCGVRKNAFFPHCPSCGTPAKLAAVPVEVSAQ